MIIPSIERHENIIRYFKAFFKNSFNRIKKAIFLNF